LTSIVIDASFAAAWFLPDEDRTEADTVAARFATDRMLVPDLFRHELRNLLLTALRRGRLSEDECFRQIARAERFPLLGCGPGDAARVARLAVDRSLTAYDAAYLSLALDERAALATFDAALAAAARLEQVEVIGRQAC
jgi:predicted nucleic acid-binding protein